MEELDKIFGGAEQLWQYIKIYAAKAGREATRIVLELYYVVKSPSTPALDKTLIIAALGYQLLPDDKKLLSREKYGLLGFLDNGLALKFAYDKVKSRVTPQIESQVKAILDQWFKSEHSHMNSKVGDRTSSGNYNMDGVYWEPQPATSPSAPQPSANSNRQNTPNGGFNDDEDVVID